MQLIENDSEIIYEGKKLRFDTTEGIQRAEAFIRMKEVIDRETGLKVPRTKVSFCYNSLSPKAPSEPFVIPCIEGRGRKKKGENIMTHVVMRFPGSVCVPIPVRTQATRTVKGSDPITAKIALEIAKKWVKVTYGNIDYMCGIHIDQPDMLVHFLLFIKDTNPLGEENAKKLFLAYHLDKFIPDLLKEDKEPEKAEVETPEEKNLKTEKEQREEKKETTNNQSDDSKTSEEPKINPEKKITVSKEEREEILYQIKEETIFASKPSERKDQLDIASIVAKVRASSEFGQEKAKNHEVVDFEEIIESEDIIEEEPEKEEEIVYVDPIAQIKANAVNQLFGLRQVLDPNKEKEETGIEQNADKQDEKEELKDEKPDLSKEGTYLEKLGKTEDEMLYDESEYPKTPVGAIAWGTDLEEEEFKEEKKVTAVFSSRNLSVMAEGSNSYDDDLEEELPEISFFVQNEEGEKEIPEEFQYEPSARTLQQRDAAASYVKGLKKAKIKKILIGIILLLVIAAAILYFLVLK